MASYTESATIWLPGTDTTTKNLLKHPEVKDIVTKAVAGVDGDAYIIGDSEWADGTQSDVLYAPKDESLRHAPIIVEVQHSVNFAFVNRSIRYCTLAYQRFQTLPVLVVFCINATSGIPIKLLSGYCITLLVIN
ncbi:hypothetical protein BDB00DRAFT_839558 [Zychaea mexicana]|uniref:uncharacterized protein n=1 Tax=Zychaea mexicana TaxID=64656 RepID=UPI0022FDE296|nr:uncharacterized protein BDB00DRAFT_839558 [Zychaea mexicana]KAI9490089.1 hypothetical protein BDB00DRAFT_839558 [Zychaea mexicana]